MRPDDVEAALDAMAAEQSDPTTDADAVVARGRRRIARRRIVAIGFTALLIAAVASASAVAHSNGDKRFVSSVPTTTRGGVVSPTTTPATTPPSVSTQTEAIPIGLAFVSPTEGWVCGDAPLYSANGADTSWQYTDNWHNVSVPTAPLAPADPQDPVCAAVPGGDAWFVRASATMGRPDVEYVHDGQANSFRFAQLPTGSSVVDLTFADADRGWALAADPTRTSRQLYGTSDGGQTWSVIAVDPPVMGSLHFTSGTDGWAVDSPPDPAAKAATILRTSDGGRTWAEVRVPSPTPTAPGFGVGITELAVTRDAIVGFGSEPEGDQRSNGPTSLFFVVSTDGGYTWTLRSAPSGDVGREEAEVFGATDAQHWQLGAGNVLWTTADGGKSWTQVAAFAGISDVTAVQFLTSDVGYVAATGRAPNDSSTVALQTLDGGNSWSTIGERAPDMLPNAKGVNFPGGIIGCPTHPLASPPSGNPPPGLVAAAYAYVTAVRHWQPASSVAYPVDAATPTGAYGDLFKFQLPSCGAATMQNAWIVEVAGVPGKGGGGSTEQTQLALSYSADGWHVFGSYH